MPSQFLTSIVFSDMRKIILLIVFYSISVYGYTQEGATKGYKLFVTLNNAPFDSLAILDYGDSYSVIIRGKSIMPFKWEFTLPDSIVARSENMMLFVPEKDSIAGAYHQIRFNRKLKNKTTSSASIGIQEAINYIEAYYTGMTLYQNNNNAPFMGVTDSVILGNVVSEDFNLNIKDESSDMAIRSIEPNYSWFYDDKIRLTYDEHFQSYLNLAEKHPDSRYLLTNLSRNLNQFKSKEDVRKIYQKLSKNITNSGKWSTEIEHYLSDDFLNLRLVNLETNQNEPIIKDLSKYNLVTFSASWCSACIKEIPLLKGLYQDLNKYLNFTYISLDHEKNIPAFQNQMVKNDISWRILYAFKDLDRLKNNLNITSIPHSILFYPNGHKEIMNLHDPKNREKLNSLVTALFPNK